jgi:hypothetical protein
MPRHDRALLRRTEHGPRQVFVGSMNSFKENFVFSLKKTVAFVKRRRK